MPRTAPALLPHGVWLDGRLHRQATLRALDESDARAALRPGATPAAALTAVLARCVTAIGGRRVRKDDVERLTAGDREALALQSYALSVSPTMSCRLECPRPGCREPLEATVAARALVAAPAPAGGDPIEVVVGEEGHATRLRFRPPDGRDLGRVAGGEGEATADSLLRRILIDAERADGGSLPAAPPQAWADAVGDALAEADPQLETALEATCPACGETDRALLDAAGFLLHELEAMAQEADREIHALAFHYHWSERDILALGPGRRRRHCRLIEAAVARSSP